MAKRLRVVRPVKVRPADGPRDPDRLYGPTQGDLAKWLSAKFCIDDQDAAAIIREVFGYIRSEVLLYDETFRIHNFGNFRKLTTAPNRNPKLFGEPKFYSYLRFNSPHRHATEMPIYDDDEECVDPGD